MPKLTDAIEQHRSPVFLSFLGCHAVVWTASGPLFFATCRST